MFRLLVEGSDDLHLIKNLLREQGVVLDPREIVDCGGVHTLLEDSLPTHLRASYDALGVVVDADIDVAARWQAIRDRLTVSGYDAPVQPSPDGLVLRSRRPMVGVWLMPDNVLAGAIEDFARQLIAPGDELWPAATTAVAALPVPRRFADAIERKAEIHTYLAWQHEPGTPLGLAITKKYFETDTALAQRFVTWVRRLIHDTH